MLKSFVIWCKRDSFTREHINAPSLGKAKAALFRGALERWPDLCFTEIVGRSAGPATTREALAYTMLYRSRPDLHAGARVRLPDGREGYISDSCSGACFSVWMDEGPALCVHPDELEVVSC